ncbi:unnamed protein product [Aspergillus oryzae var. brunneus]|uniref:Unnamed protein product n=1 Tax=Aspergillus oryzae var. brunneus TaxID=332754 RepID=A0ABQ6KMK2_ASPOZ|nr:unnamed protein product [Aspergillus oryzae var. brunneus]
MYCPGLNVHDRARATSTRATSPGRSSTVAIVRCFPKLRHRILPKRPILCQGMLAWTSTKPETTTETKEQGDTEWVESRCRWRKEVVKTYIKTPKNECDQQNTLKSQSTKVIPESHK